MGEGKVVWLAVKDIESLWSALPCAETCSTYYSHPLPPLDTKEVGVKGGRKNHFATAALMGHLRRGSQAHSYIRLKEGWS